MVVTLDGTMGNVTIPAGTLPILVTNFYFKCQSNFVNSLLVTNHGLLIWVLGLESGSPKYSERFLLF